MYRRMAGLSLPTLAVMVVLAAPAPSFAQFLGWGHGAYSYQLFDRPYYSWGMGYGNGYGSPYGQSYSAVAPVAQPFAAAPVLVQSAPVVAPAPSASALVHVHVPANAQVYFDNSPTRQSGGERDFVTPPLDNRQSYTYRVTARWMDNGQEHRENRTIRVTPGQTANVDFTAPAR